MTGTLPTTIELSSAPSPFDKRNADIVLVTSDNVAYRVHSQILSLASEVFDGMLSIPQPAPNDEHDGRLHRSVYDGLPLVPVTECSTALEPLLRFLYPVSDPALASPGELGPVLAAAVKYDMTEAIDLSRERLRGFIQKYPLEVYCIACSHGFEEDAYAAAQAVRSQGKQRSFVPQLRQTTAGCYYRLLQYCKTWPNEQPTFCHPMTVTPSYQCQRQNTPASARDDEAINTNDERTTGDDVHRISKMCSTFLEQPLHDAHVQLLSTEGVAFRVHSDILTLSSPIFERRLRELAESKGGLQTLPDAASTLTQDIIVPLQEDAETVSHLLEYLFPVRNQTKRTLDQLFQVLAAVHKYDMRRLAQELAAKIWSMNIRPLTVYLTGVKLGLTEETHKAVKTILRRDRSEVDEYVTELEEVHVETYYRLLTYIKSCHQSTSTWVSLQNIQSLFDTLLGGSPASCDACGNWRAQILDRYCDCFGIQRHDDSPQWCLYTSSAMSTLSYALWYAGPRQSTSYRYGSSNFCSGHTIDCAEFVQSSEEVARRLETSLPKFDMDEDISASSA